MAVRGLEAGQKPALLICETQRGTIDPTVSGLPALAEQVQKRGVIPKIRALAEACRDLGVPVIYNLIVRRADNAGSFNNCLLLAAGKRGGEGSMVEGAIGAEVHPDLKPAPTDIVFKRIQGLSSFYATPLDPILQSLGVRTLILAGVSTNIMIPATSIEAVNRGLQVIVPEDCVAGATPETHEFQIRETLRLLTTVTTSADVIAALKQQRRSAS